MYVCSLLMYINTCIHMSVCIRSLAYMPINLDTYYICIYFSFIFLICCLHM